MLDCSPIEILANPAQDIRPGVAVFAGDTDFDQFMRGEAAIDFREHRRSEPAIAYQDHGIEGVGAGLERATLAGG
jgi:hypothetical protein